MGGHYYLNEDKSIVKCDLMTWVNQIEDMNLNCNKHVNRDNINGNLISTVWLGLDHNFGQSSSPLLFETMIFPENDFIESYCARYSTWQEAEEGHKKAIEWLKMKIKESQDECDRLETDKGLLEQQISPGSSDSME